MPRGHEHILFVFSSAFRDIEDCNGKKVPCAVFGCNKGLCNNYQEGAPKTRGEGP